MTMIYSINNKMKGEILLLNEQKLNHKIFETIEGRGFRKTHILKRIDGVLKKDVIQQKPLKN